jgi:hypothetical protein
LAFYKPPDGAVVGALHLGREIARREFPHASVVFHAIAAVTLAGAGLVSAVASLQVGLVVLALFGHIRLLEKN